MINGFREFLSQKQNAVLSKVCADKDPISRNNSIWKIDFASLCPVMSVEPTGESKKVFDLFPSSLTNDSTKTEKIDARQVILSS